MKCGPATNRWWFLAGVTHFGFAVLIVGGCERLSVAQAEEERLIKDDSSACSDCLHIESLVVLGDAAGLGYVVPTEDVIRDEGGRYWARQDATLKVWNADGTYVGEVGRPGQGPLEFGYPVPVRAEGDLVHILDPVNSRETAVRPDFTLAYDQRIPGGGFREVIPFGSAYLVNMWLPEPGRVGLPMHIIRGSSVIASLGFSSSHGEAAQNEFLAQRVLATQGERLFSIRPFEYLLEEWQGDGQRVAAFRGPRLNEADVRPGPFNDENPAPSRIMDLRVDEEGRAWVLIWLVNPNWRESFVERIGVNGRVQLVFTEGRSLADVYTTRIDLIDLNTARIVGRLEVPKLLTSFIGTDEVLENFDSKGGIPMLQIWKLRQ